MPSIIHDLRLIGKLEFLDPTQITNHKKKSQTWRRRLGENHIKIRSTLTHNKSPMTVGRALGILKCVSIVEIDNKLEGGKNLDKKVKNRLCLNII